MAKPKWITVNPSSGAGAGIFTITFAQNTSTSSRSGIVTVKSLSGLTHEIQVTQAGKATKGKITFNYTGGEIPQKYVGQSLYFADNDVSPSDSYGEFGRIESINAGTLVVNIEYMDEFDLNTNFETLNSINSTELYFGITSSDDPTIDWDPLLSVNDPDDKDYVSQLVAAKIQNAFNGLNEVIFAESLIAPSGDITCSWGLSAANLLLASVAQETLDQSSASEVTFKVYADLYPDGQRLNNDISMNNIMIGQFTLGAGSGQSLNQPVLVRTSTNSQFKWAKEWSTVALCRFTIKCNSYSDIASVLSKSLVINGETFTLHKGGGIVYFENLEGIPLQNTTASQSLNISSNYPTLTFNRLA